MQMINVNDLIPHEKNGYFFDDITGDAWTAFIDSVQTSGIIEPIICTQDKIIVSGHQRVRAAKKLGIEEVNVEVRYFDSEDEIIKQLIETNIRQRGIGNTNPVKFGRCLKELDRLYGVRNGSAGKATTNLEVQNALPKTQSDIADQIGISIDSYKRYEALTNLIPEIADMVNNGINMTSAVAIARKLSPAEQAQLAEQISGKEKVTGSEVQQYIDEIKAVKDENRRLREEYSKQGAENVILKKKLEDVPVKEVVKEVTVEVVPDDYEVLKSQAKNADIYQKDFRRMQSEYEKMSEKWKQAEREKEQIIADRNKPESEKAENLKRSALFFCAGVSNFIEKYGGYVWLTQEIDNLEESEKEGYLRAVSALDAWVFQMKSNLEIQ